MEALSSFSRQPSEVSISVLPRTAQVLANLREAVCHWILLPQSPSRASLEIKFPLGGWCKCFEVEEHAPGVKDLRVVRKRRMPVSLEQGFLIHLVSTEQVRVISEIPQEPIQFPEGLSGGRYAPCNLAGREVLRCKDW